MLKKQQGGLKLSLPGLIIRWLFVAFNAYIVFTLFRVMFTDVGDIADPAVSASAIKLVDGMVLMFVAGIWLIGLVIGWFLIKITRPAPVNRT